MDNPKNGAVEHIDRKHDDSGATAVEYGLLIGFVVLLLATSVATIGNPAMDWINTGWAALKVR